MDASSTTQSPNTSKPLKTLPNGTRSAIRNIGVRLACVFFGLSLAFCTLLYDDDSSFLLGIICLLFGWGGYLAWYANPFIFLAGLFLLNNKPQWALGSATISTALVLTTFSIQEVERNEAGTMAPVIGYGLGFYFWLASSVVLLATSACCCVAGEDLRDRPQPMEKPHGS